MPLLTLTVVVASTGQVSLSIWFIIVIVKCYYLTPEKCLYFYSGDCYLFTYLMHVCCCHKVQTTCLPSYSIITAYSKEMVT